MNLAKIEPSTSLLRTMEDYGCLYKLGYVVQMKRVGLQRLNFRHYFAGLRTGNRVAEYKAVCMVPLKIYGSQYLPKEALLSL
jgi:hypothetical protein